MLQCVDCTSSGTDMPREFGEYNPSIPLGVTWEESFSLVGVDGLPVDLTGFEAHAQIRHKPSKLAQSVAVDPPLFEITTPNFYSSLPGWDVVEGFSIPTPISGQLLLIVKAQDTYKASPTNLSVTLVWDVRLINKATEYVIPVIEGLEIKFVRGITVP